MLSLSLCVHGQSTRYDVSSGTLETREAYQRVAQFHGWSTAPRK